MAERTAQLENMGLDNRAGSIRVPKKILHRSTVRCLPEREESQAWLRDLGEAGFDLIALAFGHRDVRRSGCLLRPASPPARDELMLKSTT